MCDSRFLLEAEASRNGEAYSNNLRERVVAAITGGRTCRETAALFGVSVASAARWLQRQRQTGNASAKRMGGFKFHKLEGERDWILARSAKAPDLTLMALQAEPAERCGALRSNLAAAQTGRHQLQKKACGPPSRIELISPGAVIGGDVTKSGSPPARLVFIDETWAKTNMIRTHGRCRRGERLRAEAPHGHWRTLTFLVPCGPTGSMPPASSTAPSMASALPPTLSNSSCLPSHRATLSSSTIWVPTRV